MLNRIFNILFLLIVTSSYCQESIPIGTWRFHPSAAKSNSISSYNGIIYATTENSIIKIDGNNAIETLTIENSLSSLNPTQVAVNSEGIVVIGYQDGDIDLIKNNTVINIPDFKIFEGIENAKNINHINFRGKDTVFLSTEAGLLAYNVSTETIIYDFIFNNGSPVVNTLGSAFQTNGDSIYFITDSRMYWDSDSISIFKDPRELSSWGDSIDAPNSTSFTCITILDNRVYVGTSGSGVYYLQNHSFVPLPNVDVGNVKSLKIFGDTLYTVFEDVVVKSLSPDSSGFDTIKSDAFSNLSDITISENNVWLSADYLQPIISNTSGEFDSFKFSFGPTATNYSKMRFIDNSMVFLPATDSAEFSIFSKGEWVNENKSSSNIPDTMGVITEVIKFNSNYYFGTKGTGLYSSNKFSGGVYSSDVFSSLSATATINDLEIDNDGNLWILQNNTNLCSITFNGVKNCLETINRTSEKFVIDDNNNFWFLNSNNDITVYNSDFSSNRTLNLKSSFDESGIDGFNDLVFDQDNRLWLGFSDGIGGLGYLANPSPVDDEVISPLNSGFPTFAGLFSSEKIIVDGGNRKWILTKTDANFLRLLDDDGKEVLQEFNTSNSPLLTSDVNDIRINSSGELFVATSKGLYSYRTDASSSSGKHNDVKVFPNPIPPGYGGIIAISGLVSDASIKVTDISGNLIHETTSNGGTALWNGKDYNGNQARTGVYLIFSSDKEGNETYVAKVAVIQ